MRVKWGLGKLLKRFMIAKSSYEYQVKVLGSEAHTLSEELKEKVRAAVERCQGIYGYRRLLAEINDGVSDSDRVSEWMLRKCLHALNLTAKRASKCKRYSSYVGEASIAPENTCLDERGKHNFRSDAPNRLWITDITEFSVGAGKVYLSPVIDCFDGMPISWSIGTSPNAELANSSLLSACEQLQVGENPRIHSDRGGHWRWPEWIEICKRYNLTRSMSRKGHSPDNARCEGFFGRLKVEFFYGENWRDISIEEFICELNDYLVRYRDSRCKSDLGNISPLQYRQRLGLAA